MAEARLLDQDRGHGARNAVARQPEHRRHRTDILGKLTAAVVQRARPAAEGPRTPDIIVTPNVGVTYSKSTKKQAEHDGFAHDDTSVMLLLSNHSLSPQTFTSPVQTAQVAPTLLKALGLDPESLQAVRSEGTQVLPGFGRH